jgi:hypothetical protein
MFNQSVDGVLEVFELAVKVGLLVKVLHGVRFNELFLGL